MEVLDSTELTEKLRWKRIEMWTQVEELLTLTFSKSNAKIHIFGSQAEATTISGITSDIDVVCHIIANTALEDLQSWEPGCGAALMIMDDNTPPGYVKLQQLYTNMPYPIYNL
ncbi:hypothetical protein ACJMK2_009635 [Sinanodonta woodiana]|uniref:Polymerase nucleotidyl transferase domain-containing protein n=1 Tax=Sinanodonta woodiana TaxID=1069815 RepID=A0ABD3VCW7_SINWO